MKMIHAVAVAAGALIVMAAIDPAFAQGVPGSVEGWTQTAATAVVRCFQLIVGGTAAYRGYEISHSDHNFVRMLVPLGAGAALVLLVPPMFGINAIPGLPL